MAAPPEATRSWNATRSSVTTPRGEAPSKVADLMMRFFRVSGPSRAGPKIGGATPGRSLTGSLPFKEARVAYRGQHVVRQVGVTHDEVGQPRVGAGVAERGSVDAAGVKSGGQRDGHGCARVPLVLPSGVDVHLGLAPNHRRA